MQAVRDAHESAEAQTQWLRTALPGQLTKKLLHQVSRAGLGCWAGHGIYTLDAMLLVVPTG
jgi:hypothetical protein